MDFLLIDYIMYGLQLFMDFQFMDFQFIDYIMYGLQLFMDFQFMEFKLMGYMLMDLTECWPIYFYLGVTGLKHQLGRISSPQRRGKDLTLPPRYTRETRVSI